MHKSRFWVLIVIMMYIFPLLHHVEPFIFLMYGVENDVKFKCLHLKYESLYFLTTMHNLELRLSFAFEVSVLC